MLFDLFVVLASAAIVAIVIQRVRLAVIPGYLITGALVGPGALGFVDSAASLDFISHLAVILLMFGIGLHLDLSFLRRGIGTMISVGVGSCLATVLLGFPLIRAFGVGGPAALALAMALSLSSTAVVLRIIAARRELRRPSGRLSFAILIVQDLLVVAMLAALPAISRWGAEGAETSSWGRVLMEAGLSFLGIVGLVVVGKLVLPRLVHETARHRTSEVLMILSVAVAIGCAGVTRLLGFSAEMGAFIAGFLLSSTHFRHELRGQIGPLRDLFMAVFFVAVGMNLDLAALADWWWVVLLGTALVVLVKGTAIGFVSWSLGASSSVAIIVGLSLAQAGEFSLILIERAVALGVMSEVVAANGIAIVVTSLIVTPSLVIAGFHCARRFSHWPRAPWTRNVPTAAPGTQQPGGEESSRRRGHAIIAGYGTIGRIVEQRLERIGVPTIVVELNANTVRSEARRGRTIVFGNVSDPEVLESLEIHEADALVLTIPDEEAALRACQAARRLVPDLYIAVRTSFPEKGERAEQLGASHVTVEEFAAAEDLCHAVMGRIAEVEKSDEVEPEAELSEAEPRETVAAR